MGVAPSTASRLSFAVIGQPLWTERCPSIRQRLDISTIVLQRSDFGGDCVALPRSQVRKNPLGFSVILHPGDHPLVTRNQLFLILYKGEFPSEDGDFHICLHPTDDPAEADGIGRGGRYHMECIFGPPGDVWTPSDLVPTRNALQNAMFYLRLPGQDV